MGRQKIKFIPTVQTQAGNFESHDSGKLFINKGTTRARVSNFPLEPGDFLVLEGNRGELDTTNYQIAFEDIPPAVPVNALWIIQKSYVP